MNKEEDEDQTNPIEEFKRTNSHVSASKHPVISQAPSRHSETEEDHKYVRYVWNKKTKRLEKRDLRLTNLETIDRGKFEKFQKVNHKSKVLCSQLENYINSSLLGEVNYEEIQQELLYGVTDRK